MFARTPTKWSVSLQDETGAVEEVEAQTLWATDREGDGDHDDTASAIARATAATYTQRKGRQFHGIAAVVKA